MTKKVYAIQHGKNPENNDVVKDLIVDTWAECLTYVKGVKGAKYKSFEVLDEAKAYLTGSTNTFKKSEGKYPMDCLHAYVDGSYNQFDERFAYGVVCVRENIVTYIENGAEKDTSEKNVRQIAGELKGAVRATEYALSIGAKRLVIFHDYEGIANHANGTWKRNGESAIKYYDTMQRLIKQGIEILFVKVDSHTGDLFNELVDEKCKEPLGIPNDGVIKNHLTHNTITVENETIKEQIQSLVPETLWHNIKVKGE